MDELIGEALDFDIFGDAPPTPSSSDMSDEDRLTAGDPIGTYLERSGNYWQQIPLPEDISMNQTNLLASMSDEDLLNVSPSLIAHIQRSEASGGTQVVSPRAVTLGGVAARTRETKRTTDMFLVGSVASMNDTWPTVGAPVPSGLFWREPIDSYPFEPAARPKTVSSGILTSTRAIEDPITKAFLLGRALVDLQRRPDVGGSAEALSELLAKCWSMDPDAYSDMGEASLAPVGELLRYAIRSDVVYPVVNAPIHARKCMSVGANTAGRHLYGEFSAIDWRRMRVLAESIFYQSSRLEGWTLMEMVTPDPPGNPRAAPNRAGILQMRPLPGSVWSFDSRTFRLDIDADISMVSGVLVPDRVRTAVDTYHDRANPIARAVDSGVHVSFSQSLVFPAAEETSETIVAGFRAVLTRHSAFSARGRTSVAAVRGFIYDSLAENTHLSSIRALWLARYLHDTTSALNLGHMLDTITTRHVAARLSDLTTDMRVRIGVEAGRRGADLCEWWSDMAAALPVPLCHMEEGSASWAIGAAHLMLHPPTDKWGKLVRAMGYASHAGLARAHLKDVRLPARIGSPDRTLQAAQAVARQLGASYGAYYQAMYDIACVLSARLRRAGNKMGAAKMVLAGLMWDIRAKAAATVVLHVDDGTPTAAGTVRGKHASYHITTSPYAAYHRWQATLTSAGCVSRDVKASYSHHAGGVVSKMFSGKTAPLFAIPVGRDARLYRYASNPERLARDIESTLEEIRQDVASIVAYYDSEPEDLIAMAEPQCTAGIQVEALALENLSVRPAEGTYWDIITRLDPAEAVDVIDTVTRMDTALSTELESAEYESPGALLDAVWGAAEGLDIARKEGRDAVV